MRSRLLWTLACISALAGCGGGGAGVGDASTTSQTQGSVTIQGSSLAASISLNGSTVYTMTGNISNAVYNDLNPTLDETEIFASVRPSPASLPTIIAMSPDGTGQRTIATLSASNAFAIDMSVSPAGTWLYYRAYDGTSTTLYRVPTAGGTPIPLIANCDSYALSPSGAKILYRLSNGFNGWHLANADGTGSALVTANTNYLMTPGFVSETTAWLNDKASNSSFVELNVTTGVLVGVGTSGALCDMAKTTFGHVPMWGTCSVSSVWSLFGNGTGNLIGNSFFIQPYEIAIYHNDLSPDPTGKSMAVAHYAGGPGAGLSVVGPSGLRSMLAGAYDVKGVGWGPLIKSRTFVGSGLYSTGAGAMLFSESGKLLPAIVLADAVTRTSCALTKISGDGNHNVAFRLDCDNLKKLHYSNLKNYSLTKVVDTATGIKGAFISFDAETGDIASVITFTRAPNARKTATGVHLEGGEMNTVYDRLGKGRPAPKSLDL